MSVLIWVHEPGVVPGNVMGLVEVSEEVATQAVSDGKAQYWDGSGNTLDFIDIPAKGNAGQYVPIEENPDPPTPGDLTGTINDFTASNPTAVATDLQDRAMLTVGGTITLEALEGGDAEAMAFIDGKSVEVLSTEPVITLDLDLTAYNTLGLSADFVLDVPPEA